MLLPIDDVQRYRTARTAWHTLAERVLAPARHAATGHIGLRVAPGGIATPRFGPQDRTVAVRGSNLSVAGTDGERSAALTTLGAAADFVGVDPGADTGVYATTTPSDPRFRVATDPDLAERLARWFAFGQSVLEQWRATHPGETPSEIQLWPEHFDLALDLGPDDAGRANYGASPGDGGHELPYLYVGPWSGRDDSFWNAGAYARLGYRDLRTATDPAGEALDFFAAGHAVAARNS